MEITVRQEAGYDLALYGFSLSYKDRAIKPEEWWDVCNHCDESRRTLDSQVSRYKRTNKAATVNAGRGKGHDKFLRQIMLWVDIEAPRYFWSEFDTYKVGTVAQSESTMHTLSSRDLTLNDFTHDNKGIKDIINAVNAVRSSAHTTIDELKGMLPESYLQRRLVTMNYGVLHTIINQRANHRLPEWKIFIEAVYEQINHPELLPESPYA